MYGVRAWKDNTDVEWTALTLTMTVIILWPDIVNSAECSDCLHLHKPSSSSSSSSALHEYRSCNIESKSIEAEVDLLQHIDFTKEIKQMINTFFKEPVLKLSAAAPHMDNTWEQRAC